MPVLVLTKLFNMDTENIPMIDDEELEKFILSLCYQPSYTKRTIPVIEADMEADVERMMAEIKAGGITKMRKVQLYTRMDGRIRMRRDIQQIYHQTVKEV